VIRPPRTAALEALASVRSDFMRTHVARVLPGPTPDTASAILGGRCRVLGLDVLVAVETGHLNSLNLQSHSRTILGSLGALRDSHQLLQPL
jgi:hypothetical protein